MIILSQDGERLVDCNTAFWSLKNGKNVVACEVINLIDDEGLAFKVILGQYSTKEKCLAVIAEIADSQQYIHYPTQTYKMPKE